MKTFVVAACMCAIAIGFFYREGVAAPGLDGAVRTTSGLVSGDPQLENGVRVFRGIPFAALPVGELRWRAPVPPSKWSGVREARSFSKECIQGVLACKHKWIT